MSFREQAGIQFDCSQLPASLLTTALQDEWGWGGGGGCQIGATKFGGVGCMPGCNEPVACPDHLGTQDRPADEMQRNDNSGLRETAQAKHAYRDQAF